MSSNNAVATIAPKKSVLIDMATRYGMEPAAFEATVRATCMRPDKSGRIPSREEFAAFLLVAKEYKLNPLTKEIHAFTAKGGGIVPIVSIDGWINLINSHPACDGFEFEFEHDEKGALVSCTCKMFRKDRSRPVVVTEWLSECIRSTEPWSMKHRMLRHKSLIQAGRYAFGFAGIYDEDEGRRIIESRNKEIQGEFSEVAIEASADEILADVPAPPAEAAAEPEKAAETAKEATQKIVDVVEEETKQDDTFPADRPVQRAKAPSAPSAGDPGGIPWELDRRLSDNDRDWLLVLKEAFEQCRVVEEIGAEWESIALPAKDSVSAYVWKKAEALMDQHVERITTDG